MFHSTFSGLPTTQHSGQQPTGRHQQPRVQQPSYPPLRPSQQGRRMSTTILTNITLPNISAHRITQFDNLLVSTYPLLQELVLGGYLLTHWDSSSTPCITAATRSDYQPALHLASSLSPTNRQTYLEVAASLPETNAILVHELKRAAAAATRHHLYYIRTRELDSNSHPVSSARLDVQPQQAWKPRLPSRPPSANVRYHSSRRSQTSTRSGPQRA